MTANTILGRAMLVNVRISVWEARKHDRQITEEVNASHAASQDAGRYHKHLFGGRVKSHQGTINAAMYAREKHYQQTLPWSDAGWRLLPTANYTEYMDAMREARARFDEALETFLADYPRLKREARARLNGMYREEDYPPAEEVRQRFSFALEFQPLPAGSDFRISLPQEELERLARDVEARVLTAAQEAMRDTWRRLAEAVEILSTRLNDGGRFLRDSMVDRIREVAESLGRLNVTQDPALEEMRARVFRELGTVSIDTLRNDPAAREEAAQKAAAVLEVMRSMYGGSGA